MYDRGINLVSEEPAGRMLPGLSKVKGTTEGGIMERITKTDGEVQIMNNSVNRIYDPKEKEGKKQHYTTKYC